MTFKKTDSIFPPNHLSQEQARDTGLALVVLCLLLGLFGNYYPAFHVALGLLLVAMTFSKLFLPVACIWLGFAKVLGSIVSRLILTLVFFLVVTPLGFIKRHTGSEPLRIREWKRAASLAFFIRNRRYTPGDLKKPF